MAHFARLRELTKQAGLDVMVIVPGANFHYLTGLDFHLMERPTLLFVPVVGKPVFIVPSLEILKWEKSGIEAEVVAWRDADGYIGAFQRAAELLQGQGRRFGVEGLRMRVLEGQLLTGYLGADVIDADAVLVDLRLRKTADEIAKHRQAIHISEQALQKTLDSLKLGMTEREIAKILTEYQFELGGAGNSFNPIVLIGGRSASPHGVPGDTPLRDGDVILFDFGTIYEGYVSDITRVFFVGDPSAEFKAVYEAVLAANAMGRATAKPGVTAAQVDIETGRVMREHGFGDYIMHRTGHGLGIDVHEHPNITESNPQILEEGMVFTIEPGLYMTDKIGVRIEDNVVITADGAESLTTFPRELTVLNLR